MKILRDWFRRRRERAKQERIQRVAIWRGILRLYEEHGESPHPAVIESAGLHLPHSMRAFPISVMGAELHRIGWYGEEGRRRIEIEKAGLMLGTAE